MALNSKNLNKLTEELFTSKDGSDVTFIVHGQEMKAHKWVVAGRSPVLKTMIEGPMSPSDNRHQINDGEITFQDFENFLFFLYTDKCKPALAKSQMKALIRLGSFYDVPYLIERYTVQIRLFDLSASDVFEYAEMALHYSPATVEFLEKCLSFIVSDHFGVPLSYRDSDGIIKWISSELVLEIVRRRPYGGRVSEDELFNKVFEWAKNVCIRETQSAPTVEGIQAIMIPLMPYFFLSEIHPLTMATTIKTYKLIPPEQLIDYLSDQMVQMFQDEPRERGWATRGGRGGGGIGGDRQRRFSPDNHFHFVEHFLDLRNRLQHPLPQRGGRGRGGAPRGGFADLD